jgi:hypothetical protein
MGTSHHPYIPQEQFLCFFMEHPLFAICPTLLDRREDRRQKGQVSYSAYNTREPALSTFRRIYFCCEFVPAGLPHRRHFVQICNGMQQQCIVRCIKWMLLLLWGKPIGYIDLSFLSKGD